MNKYYVICGNRFEFDGFIKDKTKELNDGGYTNITLSHFVYLDRSEKLAGITNPHGWFVGNWRQRMNLETLLQQLMVRYMDEPIPQTLKDIRDEILSGQS